jgi:endonuclease/exonuclease/phosphatase family metal-dependent hydrolase
VNATSATSGKSVRTTTVRRILLAGLLLLVAFVALVAIVNRSTRAGSGPVTVLGPRGLPTAGERISVLSWNLGYAALGADMDFVTDGGTRYLPRSRANVLENLRGILAALQGVDADVFLLQEMARASPLNLGVDVIDGLTPRFRDFAWVYEPEVRSRLVPPPLSVSHGTGLYSRLAVAGAEKHLIAREDVRLAGLLQREYRMLVARLPVAGTSRAWVLVNVHLAAFDDGAVRLRQLADIIAFAEQELAKGNAVVVGGDWNLELVRDRFPHTTADKDRFWLRDFPLDQLPKGWRAVFDPWVPSVRTLHKPYVKGESYVTVVDGFLVSPNIAVEEVAGIDLGFRHSDHQPVRVRLRLREEKGQPR